MKYTLDVLDSVYDELADVHAYIAADSPQNARTWLRGAYEAIDSLRSFPGRCGFARENENAPFEIRQLLYKSHRILFTVRGDTVHVLHVRHGSQRELEEVREPADEPEDP